MLEVFGTFASREYHNGFLWALIKLWAQGEYVLVSQYMPFGGISACFHWWYVMTKMRNKNSKFKISDFGGFQSAEVRKKK